jgi:hypothetical protein
VACNSFSSSSSSPCQSLLPPRTHRSGESEKPRKRKRLAAADGDNPFAAIRRAQDELQKDLKDAKAFANFASHIPRSEPKKAKIADRKQGESMRDFKTRVRDESSRIMAKSRRDQSTTYQKRKEYAVVVRRGPGAPTTVCARFLSSKKKQMKEEVARKRATGSSKKKEVVLEDEKFPDKPVVVGWSNREVCGEREHAAKPLCLADAFPQVADAPPMLSHIPRGATRKKPWVGKDGKPLTPAKQLELEAIRAATIAKYKQLKSHKPRDGEAGSTL